MCGIGSDFDGIELPPQQLDDVTTYPLTKSTARKGIVKRTSTKY
jgi:membrane dipeptidase